MFIKKLFFIGLLCMSQKTLLSRIKKNSLAETLRTLLKAVFYAPKLLLHVPFFAVRKHFHFHKPKVFFCTNLYELSAKAAFLRTKSLLFTQTFPYCYPKLLFSTLRRPFQPPLTYCPQKFPIFTNQKPFFCTNPSLIAIQSNPFLPSISHSNHP